jgi:hypothetical protein
VVKKYHLLKMGLLTGIFTISMISSLVILYILLSSLPTGIVIVHANAFNELLPEIVLMIVLIIFLIVAAFILFVLEVKDGNV